MKSIELPLPRFAFIVVTRSALAAGIALLAARRMRDRSRGRAGFLLTAIGAVTTIPALFFLRRALAETGPDG